MRAASAPNRDGRRLPGRPGHDGGMPITVRRADLADHDPLAGMLTRSFLDDPVIEWFFPDPAQRARRVGRFFAEIVLGGGLSASTEVYTTDDRDAAAVWAPPDQW